LSNATGLDRPEDETPGKSLLILCALAVVAGAGIGFVGGAFRWGLDRAADIRHTVLIWSHGLGWVGWVIPVVTVAILAAVASLLVRNMPIASGSGVQHVEAVDRGALPAAPFLLLPVKFFGGLLALGAGLVLGREGPTVQMGAAFGAAAARRAKRDSADIATLQTSLAGAGLAVAFNAPIGGALFVFEEVTKSFKVRTVLPTMVAVAVAVGCARLIIGDEPDFAVRTLNAPGVQYLPVFIVFGLITGFLGVVYNRLILSLYDRSSSLKKIPNEAKAAFIGGLIGLALWFDPFSGGGGDALSQQIVSGHSFALPMLIAYLAVRFVAGPLSYASKVPGGLFAPLLLVGALWGVLFAQLISPWVTHPDLAISTAIVGMGAFFAATVRAPMTGIVIVMEMTAATALSLPMLVAAGCAVLVATMIGAVPIYDSLGERMMADPRINPPSH